MPRDYHTEFSSTAGSSCIINKEYAEARLSSQTDAHCVFPGETNLFCYFPLLSLLSVSQAMPYYHFYLSFSPKRQYYIRQNMHSISVLLWITSSLPFPSELLPICCLAVFHLIQAHFQLTEVASGASSCFLTTCRIHLLFKFLLFSCYFLFPIFSPITGLETPQA